jgi:hypothetical protein
MHTLSLPCVAAALMTFSTPAHAQTSTAQTTTATAQTAAPQNAQNAGQALMDARKALNAVLNTPAPNQVLFEKLNEIKTHYLELEKAYSSRGDWQTHYAAIVQRVSDLTDGATSTGTSSTSTATTGATGTSGTTAPAKLDASAINNLQAFRKALNDFSVAMGGSGSASATATMSPSGKTTVTTGVAGATGTTGTTTTATSSSSGTTSSTSVSGSVATPPAATPQQTVTAQSGVSAGDQPVDAQFAAVNALIAQMVSSTAMSASAETICVDRKMLQDLQAKLAQLQQSVKKP